MKNILFLFAVIICSFSYGQKTGAISGKILDSELFNEPLLMATVSIKGTELSAQTNFNGNFEINDIPKGNYTLQVQFLGYELLELPIVVKKSETTFIQESLKAKTIQIDLATLNTSTKEKDIATSALK